MSIESEIYEAIFARMTLGLIIVDQDRAIKDWNDWLSSKSGVSKEDAIGRRLESLFPDRNFQRLNWALDNVFEFGAPQVLSQILNSYLIPISLGKDHEGNDLMMQQHIEILPIKKPGGGWFAVVAIEDVTLSVHQRNVLMKMAFKLEDESFRDALTGVYNRRFLWEYLEKQISEAKVTNQEIACLMIDLDHFKNVNDTYGHEKGDEVLLYFVDIINKHVRQSDLFARYGGEEFILIMPSASLKVAKEKAELLLTSVQSESEKSTLGIPITCSIGVSIWTPTKSNLSGKVLVDHADQALYKAKENGRNRVEFYHNL